MQPELPGLFEEHYHIQLRDAKTGEILDSSSAEVSQTTGGLSIEQRFSPHKSILEYVHYGAAQTFHLELAVFNAFGQKIAQPRISPAPVRELRPGESIRVTLGDENGPV